MARTRFVRPRRPGALPGSVFDPRNAGRKRARGGLDARNGDRLRPARRQRGIGDVDPDWRRLARAAVRDAPRPPVPASAASISVSGPAWTPTTPTPSRRCCSSRSAARRAESMMRLIRPLTMIATFFETAVATPIFCSITSTDMSPSSPRRTSISSTWATMTGASPSVGSSMMSRCGLVSSAREIASICCSPPESWPPPWSLRSARRGNVS